MSVDNLRAKLVQQAVSRLELPQHNAQFVLLDGFAHHFLLPCLELELELLACVLSVALAARVVQRRVAFAQLVDMAA